MSFSSCLHDEFVVVVVDIIVGSLYGCSISRHLQSCNGFVRLDRCFATRDGTESNARKSASSNSVVARDLVTFNRQISPANKTPHPLLSSTIFFLTVNFFVLVLSLNLSSRHCPNKSGERRYSSSSSISMKLSSLSKSCFRTALALLCSLRSGKLIV